jgi:hypothetical protein
LVTPLDTVFKCVKITIRTPVAFSLKNGMLSRQAKRLALMRRTWVGARQVMAKHGRTPENVRRNNTDELLNQGLFINLERYK